MKLLAKFEFSVKTSNGPLHFYYSGLVRRFLFTQIENLHNFQSSIRLKPSCRHVWHVSWHAVVSSFLLFVRLNKCMPRSFIKRLLFLCLNKEEKTRVPRINATKFVSLTLSLNRGYLAPS